MAKPFLDGETVFGWRNRFGMAKPFWDGKTVSGRMKPRPLSSVSETFLQFLLLATVGGRIAIRRQIRFAIFCTVTTRRGNRSIVDQVNQCCSQICTQCCAQNPLIHTRWSQAHSLRIPCQSYVPQNRGMAPWPCSTQKLWSQYRLTSHCYGYRTACMNDTWIHTWIHGYSHITSPK